MGMHVAQALDRVEDVGTEGHTNHAQAVRLSSRVGIADRDRRDRHQAGGRQFVVKLEVAPQCTAADREHHVVHRRTPYQPADLAELLQREAARLEHAVRRDLGIEARDRLPLRMQEGVADRAQHDWAEALEGPHQRTRHFEGLHHVVQQRAGHQRQRARRRRREPGFRRIRWPDGRAGVVQQRGDLGATIQVDRRMMDLGQQREAVRRQVEERVEALDQVDLPQRAREVERPRVDA